MIGVPINSTITLSFSEAMNQTTTQAALSISPAAGCNFSWNASADVLTCTATSDLSVNTVYTVTLAATASDLAGNELGSSESFSFTTGTGTAAFCFFDGSSSNFDDCVFAP
jgi:hypothetical protein